MSIACDHGVSFSDRCDVCGDELAALPLPTSRDFPWHQSSVAALLRCPEAFRLRYVAQAQADHRAVNFAAQLGTADHAGLEWILKSLGRRDIDVATLRDVVLEAFAGAVARAQEEDGASFDPEAVDRAMERLEGERLERLVSFAQDPRIHAIRWVGVEQQFRGRERRSGRLWQGTIDALGVAERDVEGFGVLGREPVDLRAGDGLIVDWKTGELPPFGYVERRRSVQLGVYRMAPGVELPRIPGRWRTFLGSIPDLDRPKAPTDDQGKRIPKLLPKRINPAWAEAAGLSCEEAAKTKGRPKGIPKGLGKWLEQQPNPAFEKAISRPRGPLFHEAIVAYPQVLETVRAAIRQAEAGIYPASGALTGQCGRCAYQTQCIPKTQPQDPQEGSR